MLWLALKTLFHEKVRLFITVIGITVSTVLAITQIGMYFGFMGDATAIIRHTDADIFIVTSAELERYERLHKQAEAAVEYYKRLLDKAVIKAPISGKVIRKYAQEGELVNLSSAETLLAAIADVEKVRVNAEVDETDIGKIKFGDPVDVTSDAYTGKVFKGGIEEIADYVGLSVEYRF